MSEIDKAIELLSARIMELARENTRLAEENVRLKGVERRALDVDEIATLLGVHSNTVRRWIKAGKIPAFVLPTTAEGNGSKGAYRSVRAWTTDIYAQFAPSIEAASAVEGDGEKGGA